MARQASSVLATGSSKNVKNAEKVKGWRAEVKTLEKAIAVNVKTYAKLVKQRDDFLAKILKTTSPVAAKPVTNTASNTVNETLVSSNVATDVKAEVAPVEAAANAGTTTAGTAGWTRPAADAQQA
jgi:hypothetical protein